ncbi:MAG TPA: GTP cyclohydrolase I [Anaeromyxobacteraceae bacterium]|nr:GTP cyclohydrolase I [Anaeromyxobacteraceae bacterium]
MGIRPLRKPRPPGLAAADAVEQFLDALGLPEGVRAGESLRGTARRVAEAWLEDLVDGYGRDPAQILAETMPASGRELVAVTGIDFHSVCPHHLLPSRGLAHVGYVPGGRVVGFGQIVKLVDCLAHRLVLEEDLARQIAEALVRHLGARGAACVLDAEQLCMTVRGSRRPRARAHAQAFAGTMVRDRGLQRRFLDLVRAPPRASGGRSGAKAPRLRRMRREAEAKPGRASGPRAGRSRR